MSNFYTKSIKQTEKDLRTNIDFGLNDKEVLKRRKKYGPNKLPDGKPLSWLYLLLSQFINPLVYILVIAALISILLGEFIDFVIIVAALAINVGIGFFQEYKADRTLFYLKKLVQLKAKVRRDGIKHEMKAEAIVPGDIIYLEAGDRIPADARLVKVIDFAVIEAALTGESVPSVKSVRVLKKAKPLADRENMVYMGTQVAAGKAVAVVVGTGEGTELGKIVGLVKETKREATPLQKQFARLSKTIGLVIAFMAVVIFVIGFFRGHSVFEILIISVAVAVAAIPEGLPAAVAISLALAMQRIFKKKGLVKKLIAAETLGSTTVICTDKTGTLTEGEMAVSGVITWGKNGEKEKSLALKIGLLNNNAVIENPEEGLKNWKVVGSPTEKALLLAASGAGLSQEKLGKKERRIDEIPFSSEKKFMATLHELKGHNVVYIKGAPERVIEMSSYYLYSGSRKKFSSIERKKLILQLDNLTGKGLRVIAVAYRETKDKKLKEDDTKNLILVGFMALKDPLRSEAKRTIRLARSAGVRTIVVTGDHRLTALAIAKELGMGVGKGEILEGTDLDKMTDEKLRENIEKIKIFARIEPKHKVRIVDAWQSKGQVVAMIGDGVNDAPALKSSNIGVAVGSGTDVTKETSDVILLDNNLSTLVRAIEQGRIAFENIRKVTLYLLGGAFSEILLIGGALLLGLPLPVLAAQILWVNIIEDGLPGVALAFEPGEKEVMKDRPRKIGEPILNSEMNILIFAIGTIVNLGLLGLFWWLMQGGFGGLDLAHIRTIIFAALSIDTFFYIFSCRSLRFNIWHKNPFSNRFIILAVLVGSFFLISGIYFPPFQAILRTVPLTLEQWILPLTLTVFEIFLVELVKWIFIVRHKV